MIWLLLVPVAALVVWLWRNAGQPDPREAPRDNVVGLRDGVKVTWIVGPDDDGGDDAA